MKISIFTVTMFSFRRSTYKNLDDSELIAKYKETQHREAFGIIYERYGHLVMGLCLKYLKDEEEAQDLCSKIFEELGAKIKKHSIDYFKAWLYRVAKNECMMYLRKNHPFYVSTDQIQLTEEANSENTALREKQYNLVEQAIALLNEQQALCIRLFYFDDLSYVEIANKTNLDLKQVKSYIQNGKRNLKNLLQSHEEFET